MSMEDKKKKPDIPPNYVTLQQLKERWIKEQQRKQEQMHEQQDPEVAVVDQVEEEEEEEQQHKQGEGGNRSKPIRDYRGRNRRSRVSRGGAHPERTDHGVEVTAISEGSGRECSVAETKSAELVDKGKKKLNDKGKLNNKGKKKKKKKNEEKGELGREARGPAIKNEKENGPARSYRKVREIRMEFRPKMNSIVAEIDSTVGIERKTEVVEDGVDPTTDIEQKFGDLEKTKERLESQIKVNNPIRGAYRGYNGVPNGRNREKGGYKDGFNRGNRGGYSGFNRSNRGGHGGFNHGHRGGYGGFNRGTGGYNAVNVKYRGGQGEHRVWVRKEEAADGGIGMI